MYAHITYIPMYVYIYIYVCVHEPIKTKPIKHRSVCWGVVVGVPV